MKTIENFEAAKKELQAKGVKSSNIEVFHPGLTSEHLSFFVVSNEISNQTAYDIAHSNGLIAKLNIYQMLVDNKDQKSSFTPILIIEFN